METNNRSNKIPSAVICSLEYDSICKDLLNRHLPNTYKLVQVWHNLLNNSVYMLLGISFSFSTKEKSIII